MSFGICVQRYWTKHRLTKNVNEYIYIESIYTTLYYTHQAVSDLHDNERMICPSCPSVCQLHVLLRNQCDASFVDVHSNLCNINTRNIRQWMLNISKWILNISQWILNISQWMLSISQSMSTVSQWMLTISQWMLNISNES